MRPAQLTPENFDSDSVDLGALFTSMRPAQLTPENRSLRTAPRPRREYFNEAGAINAGKLCAVSAMSTACADFNEAGAINAGKPPGTHGSGAAPTRLQ